MIVETKFDVGDVVWPILSNPKRVLKHCPTCGKPEKDYKHQTWSYWNSIQIETITIYLFSGGSGMDIMYHGDQSVESSLPIPVSESYCFVSEELARAECDKRNQESENESS